jgi:hypothetical protein
MGFFSDQKGAMGFFSDHKSSPTRVWDFFTTGLYILLPVIRINLQVLTGRWDDLFSSGIGFGTGFGDTGMEPGDLDL